MSYGLGGRMCLVTAQIRDLQEEKGKEYHLPLLPPSSSLPVPANGQTRQKVRNQGRGEATF